MGDSVGYAIGWVKSDRADCNEYLYAMDMLAESRFAFRQGQTVQPFTRLYNWCFVGVLLPRRAERKPTSWPRR